MGVLQNLIESIRYALTGGDPARVAELARVQEEIAKGSPLADLLNSGNDAAVEEAVTALMGGGNPESAEVICTSGVFRPTALGAIVAVNLWVSPGNRQTRGKYAGVWRSVSKFTRNRAVTFSLLPGETSNQTLVVLDDQGLVSEDQVGYVGDAVQLRFDEGNSEEEGGFDVFDYIETMESEYQGKACHLTLVYQEKGGQKLDSKGYAVQNMSALTVIRRSGNATRWSPTKEEEALPASRRILSKTRVSGKEKELVQSSMVPTKELPPVNPAGGIREVVNALELLE